MEVNKTVLQYNTVLQQLSSNVRRYREQHRCEFVWYESGYCDPLSSFEEKHWKFS